MKLRLSLATGLLLWTAIASATVFERRSDEELVAHAGAIVVALVRDAAPRLRADGYVATDYHLIVEQTLKGSAPGLVTVSEVGGTLGERTTIIEGSATYAPGERVIAFLRNRGDGTWFTASMAMGRFSIRDGVAIRANDAPRRADAFMSYIRDAARGTSPKPAYFAAAPAAHPPIAPNGNAKNYALTASGMPVRWQGCETSCPGGGVFFYTNGSMPYSTSAGINAGLAAWTNDPASNIVLQLRGTSVSTSPNANDNTNVIYLSYNGAFAGVCDGVLACTIGSGNFTHSFDGDTWVSISDADIIVSPNASSAVFTTLITHELGHAIGFRHSDQGSPASSAAIMNSSINSTYGSTLQPWDKDAVDSLYGAGPVCQPPVIATTNPSGNTSVNQGQPAQISVVVASGTPTIHFQWYDGVSGDTTNPVGTDSANFTTPAINTVKNYWVKVSNGCGSANSATITLTPVAGCTPPLITLQPSSGTVGSGLTAQLSVGSSGTAPFAYQWYQGQSGDVSTPMPNGSSQNFTTPPLTQTTSFWVRVSNQCGGANSATATISVSACGAGPAITLQPASMSLSSGQTTYLIAAATAATSYQWYQGTAPDTTNPVGGSAPSNARFVNQLYIDLLNRTTDPAASALIGLLDTAAATRSQVATLVLNSTEYRTRLITSWYQSYLHRSPSASDVAFFLPAFTGGVTYEQIEAQIFGSPEYFALAGGTNAGWLNEIYNDVLHRAPDAGAMTAFTAALATNSRASVALSILNSTEARTALVRGWYSQYLRRSPSPVEDAAIAGLLAERDELLQAFILGSGEYFNFGTILPVGPIAQTTSYWVQAINACATANSSTATLTIPDCVAPVINSMTPDSTIGVGSKPTLSVLASGPGPLTYVWYRGQSGDASNPVGTQPVLAGSPIDTPGTYPFWVRVSNSCKSVDSPTKTVTVTCTEPAPLLISAPPTEPATKSYNVTVLTRLSIYAKFELQESTTPDFANPTTMTSTNGVFAIPAKTIAADTKFYYRARGFLACNSAAAGPYTATASTLVTVPPPAFPTLNVGLLPCSCVINQPFFLGGVTQGKKAVADATTTFNVTTDKPWITVSPSNGTLPPEGTTVTLSIDTTQLGIGSTEATVTVSNTTASPSVGILAATTSNTPVSISLVTPVTPKPKDSNVPLNALLIPAVAHADGFGGSHFVSDVRMTNTSSQQISYELDFTPSNTDGTTTGKSTTISVDAGATIALNDIVKNFYGGGVAGDSGSGTLEIRPLTTLGKDSGVNVQFVTVAASRTYNATTGGTYGQYIPALPIANFLAKSQTNALSRISLQQVADSKAYRTNIGFAEGGGQPADLLVTLLDAKNNPIAQQTLHLQAFQQTQAPLAAFFNVPGGSIPEGRVEVNVTSDTGKVTAYASVLDNATSDPLLVFPVDPSTISSSRYVVPGVAELAGAAGSNFHTDMRIYNAGTAGVNVTLTYVPLGGGASPAPVPMTVSPGEVKVIDNVLPSLWSLSGTGGAVIATTDSDSQLVLTARTFSRNDAGGTYGQFIPGVTSSDAVGNGERSLNVVQLEQSPSFRSNLGLVEVTGNPVTVEIKGYSPDSKVAATATQTLAGGQFVQLNAILASMGFGNVYNGRVAVRVIDGTGRVASYGSVIDNRTQDPTYVPAQ